MTMLNDEALLDMAANLRRRDISLQVYFTHTLLMLLISLSLPVLPALPAVRFTSFTTRFTARFTS